MNSLRARRSRPRGLHADKMGFKAAVRARKPKPMAVDCGDGTGLIGAVSLRVCRKSAQALAGRFVGTKLSSRDFLIPCEEENAAGPKKTTRS
jgi:hypothetical protein